VYFFVALTLCVIALLPSFSAFLSSVLSFFLYLRVSYFSVKIFSSLVAVGLIVFICYLAFVRVSLLLKLLVDFLFLAIR
jgi:hypothetical protein